jgi:hypothetical protein
MKKPKRRISKDSRDKELSLIDEYVKKNSVKPTPMRIPDVCKAGIMMPRKKK